MKNPKFSTEKIGMLKSIYNHLRLAWRLLRDVRVPSVLKVLPFAPLLYVLFPIDVLPDMIPVIGQLDDLGVILLGLESFIALAPQDVVQSHRDDIASEKPFGMASNDKAQRETIDGDWKVVDRE
jgi:uncharacterized membrane protein YkvA (DUF1232 family)